MRFCNDRLLPNLNFLPSDDVMAFDFSLQVVPHHFTRSTVIMGFCFSCCRRKQRRKAADEESEPLLNGRNSDNITPVSGVEKFGVILGALRVGKLPSQAQITIACQKMLLSDVLSTRERNVQDLPEQGRRVLWGSDATKEQPERTEKA